MLEMLELRGRIRVPRVHRRPGALDQHGPQLPLIRGNRADLRFPALSFCPCRRPAQLLRWAADGKPATVPPISATQTALAWGPLLD
jgi:hypothetical protein